MIPMDIFLHMKYRYLECLRLIQRRETQTMSDKQRACLSQHLFAGEFARCPALAS